MKLSSFKMNSIQQNRFDYIEKLPIDASEITPTELKIMNTLFSGNTSTTQNLKREVKTLIILSTLFVLISLKYVDDLIIRFFPIMESSPYLLIIAKSLIFSISYFIINNFHLIRK